MLDGKTVSAGRTDVFELELQPHDVAVWTLGGGRQEP
jgi:hypothetical protein